MGSSAGCPAANYSVILDGAVDKALPVSSFGGIKGQLLTDEGCAPSARRRRRTFCAAAGANVTVTITSGPGGMFGSNPEVCSDSSSATQVTNNDGDFPDAFILCSNSAGLTTYTWTADIDGSTVALRTHSIEWMGYSAILTPGPEGPPASGQVRARGGSCAQQAMCACSNVLVHVRFHPQVCAGWP